MNANRFGLFQTRVVFLDQGGHQFAKIGKLIRTNRQGIEGVNQRFAFRAFDSQGDVFDFHGLGVTTFPISSVGLSFFGGSIGGLDFSINSFRRFINMTWPATMLQSAVPRTISGWCSALTPVLFNHFAATCGAEMLIAFFAMSFQAASRSMSSTMPFGKFAFFARLVICLSEIFSAVGMSC